MGMHRTPVLSSRPWLALAALVTIALTSPAGSRPAGVPGLPPQPPDLRTAFDQVLARRALEPSGLAASAAAAHRSLSTLDRLLSAQPPSAEQVEQALLERWTLDLSRERLDQDLAQSRRRLESLGMARDAATLRADAEALGPRLTKVSELLHEAAALQGRTAAVRRLDGILTRLRHELARALGQLTDGALVTTRIGQQPLEEVTLSPEASPATAQAHTYIPGPAGANLTGPAAAGLTQPASIQDLAQQLGFDPLRIYAHVRNTLRFELYFGLLKGPQATLETGAGNDYDLAALTGALLEASGFTVRYVRGTTIVPIADMVSWLGLENAAAANTILNTAGIAATPVTVNSVLNHYRVDRVWVEVQAPVRPGGDLVWFPLDTAFKRHDLTPGLNGIPGLVPFDEPGYLSATRPELTYEYYQQQVRDYLLANEPGLSLGEVPVGMAVIPETPSALPRSLPHQLFALGSTFSSIPDSLKHKARVRLRYQGIDRISHELFLPNSSLGRLTLSYAVDPNDQSVVDSHGGLANTPAFLVDVQPRLKLDGVAVATAGSIPYLASVTLEIDFTKPGPLADGTSVHTLRAGEWAGIGIDAQQISPALLQRQAEEIVAATQLEQQGGSPDPDDLIGALLYYEVMRHHQSVRLAEETSADLAHYRRVRGVSEGIAAATQQVLHLGGVPFTTIPGGLVLDVPRQIVSNFPLDNDSSDRASLLRVSGFNGSAQEHATWEELLNVPGISTIKSLQLANVRAVPIFVINNTDGNPANDCSVLCPQLNLNPATESAIIAEANSGRVVTVPRDPTPLNDWDGVGYLSENLSTGAAAYIISGGLNSAQSGEAGAPGPPWEAPAHGGAVTIILADGTILVVPAGLLGDYLGSAHAGDPVNIANGNFFRDEIDFVIPALGEPLSFHRVYNSQSTDDGPLGPGWAHNYADRLIAQPGGEMIWLDGRGTAYTFQPDPGLPGAFLSPPGLRESLTTISGGFRLTRYDGRIQTFDSAGRLVSRADRNANTCTFLYDGSGRLQTVRDPVNRSLTLAYNGAGKISSVTDFTGRAWTYAYGAGNRLGQVTSPSNAQTLAVVVGYEYDAAGRLRTITEANGGIRRIRYYANGRVAQVVDPHGYPMTLVYNPFKSETRVTDERGLTEIHTFNAAGNLVALARADGSIERWEYVDNRMTSHTDALGGVEIFEHDADGDLIRSVDPTLRETTFDHAGPYSSLMKITRPVGREVTFGYDGNGNVTSITDPESGARTMMNNARGLPDTVTDARLVTTTYTYEVDGQVATRSKPLSFAESFAHNPRGTLSAWTDANGNARTYAYDLLDRVTTTTDADLHAELRGYDAAGRLVRVTNARGGVTQYEYDLLDRVTRVVHPDGSSRRLAYDEAGNLVAETDELGRVTQHTYDARNRNIRTRLPDGGVIRRAYDAAGRLISSADPRGNVTRYEYDAAGRLTLSTDALNHSIARTYDPAGNLESVTDRRGAVTTYAYDDNLRVSRVDGPSGRLETFDYDANGNETDRTRYDVSGVGTIPPDPRTLPDAIKRRSLKSYDALERVDTATDPGGGVTGYDYDPAGNVVGVTDPRMNTTTYAYTKTNLVRQVVQPDLGLTQIQYDAAGNRIRVTGPTGGITRWTYDSRNRVSTRTDPLGDVTSYEYDAAGNVVRQNNPDGGWVRHTYDPMNRPRRTERSDGTWTDRVYDLAGNLVRATTEKTVLTYGYDALNRVSSETLSIKGTSFSRTATYQYDNESNLVGVTDPTGRSLTYGYDAAGQLTQITSSTLGTMVQITPDGYGQRGALSYGNGRAGTLQFDRNGRPTSINWTAPVASFGYVRDPAGNPTTVTESLGGASETLTIGYDTMNRPGSSTASVAPGLRSENFAYDQNGNLTNPGTGAITTFNSANQPIGDGTRTYEYDRQGCRASVVPGAGAAVRTAHDPEYRVTSIDDGSSLTRITYDALDRPVEIDQGGVLTRVVHALQNRLVEYDAAGAATALYTMSSRLDDLFAVQTGGTVYYAHTDAIGSVRAVTNAAGAVAGTRQFGLFGRQQATSGTPSVVPYGFAGRPSYLGGQLVDMRARLYDPRVGAFLSPDPLGVLSKFPNPYAYASNRPLMFVDPLGLSPEGPSWTNRLFGGLRLLGGLGETALGILGILAPDPTLLTKVGGGLLTAHGLDQVQAGLRQLWTGEATRSLTSLGLGAGAELLGASDQTAYYIGEFGDAGVGIVLTLGTAGAINAAGASARTTAELAARAEQVHGALDPIAQAQRTTAVLETTAGRIVAGGARDLTPAQRALLGPGEIAAKLPGAHAEVTALQAAQQLGATPQALAVTRAICPSCQVVIQQAGGTLTSPTTVIFLVKP